MELGVQLGLGRAGITGSDGIDEDQSVRSSHVDSLSTRRNGGGGITGSSVIVTLRGPRAPRCSQTEAEPGPPLKLNMSGRAGLRRLVERVSDEEDPASVSPFESLIGISPAVAVYLSSLPSTVIWWCVIAESSSVDDLAWSFSAAGFGPWAPSLSPPWPFAGPSRLAWPGLRGKRGGREQNDACE